MQTNSTIVCVAIVVLMGKMWIDVVDIFKYKMRANMCLRMAREAIELFERYSD